MRVALAHSRWLRVVVALIVAAAALPFVATQAVHFMFHRPMLDSADVAILSLLFAIWVFVLAVFGFAFVVQDFADKDQLSDREPLGPEGVSFRSRGYASCGMEGFCHNE